MPVEQIKSQLDIVGVIGAYVKLKRQGTRPQYVGLCPFHSEKTPSFKVHGERQSYKCFGCDAGGDVLSFVQRIESLDFPETLKLLAERHTIVLSTAQSPVQPRPKLTDTERAEVERFRIALERHVERLLAEHKKQMWAAFEAGLPLQDNAPLFSEPVRELTAFLAEMKRWPVHRAAQALGQFRRSQPVLTAQWLNDIRMESEILEVLVASFIGSHSFQERVA